MQKVLSCLLLSAALISTAAWAQNEGVTEREVSEISRGVFDSPLTLSGRVGALGFADANDGYTSRIMEGIAFNWSPSEAFRLGGVNFGLEAGLMFSHLGPSGSNFVGTNSPPGDSGSGANAFWFPLNVVAGYKFTDKVLLTANVGAAAIYRSVSNQMLLGRGSDVGGGSSTEFFPEAGVNVGYSLGQSIAINLRGDYIPVPGRDVFSTSLGATIPLA